MTVVVTRSVAQGALIALFFFLFYSVAVFIIIMSLIQLIGQMYFWLGYTCTQSYVSEINALRRVLRYKLLFLWAFVEIATDFL